MNAYTDDEKGGKFEVEDNRTNVVEKKL